jgi:prepilin-type N-terminal cleavage/methylation domain-containing protein
LVCSWRVKYKVIKSLQARKTHGFTLIELLVVIAIIAILAALILSAVNKSKGTALQAQCASQTKQLALAVQLYANDNRDSLPWPNWGFKSPGWLYAVSNQMPPAPSISAYQQGLLWP